MKRTFLVLATSALLLGVQDTSHAQRHSSSDLNRIAEAIEQRVEQERPDWRSEPITPATPSGNSASDKVKIRDWTSPTKSARVSIVYHESEEEAVNALRKIVANFPDSRATPGLGDEAFVWGLTGEIAIRKGNLTLYVSASVKQIDLTGIKSRAEIDRARDEQAKIATRSFAQLVATALALL
ncbi:MAG: hypothetical protein ACR2GW_01705 [Pyrinomonadaceae bacterium]